VTKLHHLWKERTGDIEKLKLDFLPLPHESAAKVGNSRLLAKRGILIQKNQTYMKLSYTLNPQPYNNYFVAFQSESWRTNSVC